MMGLDDFAFTVVVYGDGNAAVELGGTTVWQNFSTDYRSGYGLDARRAVISDFGDELRRMLERRPDERA